MERFLKQHEGRIKGVLSGFDRVLFRGTLRSISYCKGADRFLSLNVGLAKDYMEFAEGLSQEIKEHVKKVAKESGRREEYVKTARESKEEIAIRIAKEDGIKEGLICIISTVEVCQSFAMRRDREAKKLLLTPERRKCLHYYFYYQDRDYGLMHVRLQSWMPFGIQVCINGREWLARAMRKEGIGYKQADNCFTSIDNLERAQELMDKLVNQGWAGWLKKWGKAVNPLMGKGHRLKLHEYYWSVRQSEYATDVMFKEQEGLKEIYAGLVKHAMGSFSSEDVLRFLGRRTTKRFNGEVTTDLRRVEGIRVKHWVEENSIKMYDKAGSVLRIETTINNPREHKVRRMMTRNGKKELAWVRMRKGIVDIRRRVEVSRSANERYLEALSVVGFATPSHRILDKVSKRVEKKGRKFRALRPISEEETQVFKAVMKGQYLMKGIRNKDIRQELYGLKPPDEKTYRSQSAAIGRCLALLRAHGLIYKVQTTNYYRITIKGRQVMSTALKFRENDVILLAA